MSGEDSGSYKHKLDNMRKWKAVGVKLKLDVKHDKCGERMASMNVLLV
jgi:hypothetical protein